MWFARILIVFFGWACLYPTPGASIDFFRSITMFTMCMTYDYFSLMFGAWSERRFKTFLMFAFAIFYSGVFLTVSLMGMFRFAILDANNMNLVIFFPETPIETNVDRWMLVIWLLGYPFIAMIEMVLHWVRMYQGKEQSGVVAMNNASDTAAS